MWAKERGAIRAVEVVSLAYNDDSIEVTDGI